MEDGIPLARGKNRLMKYNHNSKIPLRWNEPELLQFRSDIERICLSKLKVVTTPLAIEKFNILKNKDLIEPPRVVV